jgi:tetraacyldisaccharide 4'-kinase
MLVPFELAYRAVMAIRNQLYDAHWLAVHDAPVPVISVGNLSVGGTGKTPLTAYLVQRFVALGATPAIVLRGYGDDEPLVHAKLNPGVRIVVDPDRRRGGIRARALGCDVVVLDDAFQHRRAGRLVDLVLVSADRFDEHPRLLPAGPLREGLGSLRRASLVLVTRKAVTAADARMVAATMSRWADVPVAVALLATDGLVGVAGQEQAVGALAGKRVLAVAGIADPESFAEQLRASGLGVELRAYRDHHAFTADDVQDILVAASHSDAVLCTLKDAVKLTPLWTRSAPPLWYVSQRVVLEAGAEHVEAAIARALDARH